MKEIALIIGLFTAMMQITAGIGLVMYTVDVTAEFRDSYDDIKNGDTEALKDFIENRAEDLVDIAVDEAQNAIVDTAVEEIIKDYR